MNQYYADTIDQLDFVLDQLSVGDRNHDRFAMMLIDNVMELCLHTFGQNLAHRTLSPWTKESKDPEHRKLIQRVLGPYFEEKAKAAAKLGLIADSSQDSIIELHRIRNTAYHEGRRHEGILGALASFYLEIACDAHVRFRPTHWMMSTADKYSARVKKYLETGKGTPSIEKFQDVFRSIGKEATARATNLPDALADDLKATIDRTDHNISFLANALPPAKPRSLVVRHAQAWRMATDPAVEARAAKQGYNAEKNGSLSGWLMNNARFDCPADPIPKWRSRCDDIRYQQDNHIALRKYRSFLGSTEQIRSDIREAASSLDSYIQGRIDMARGK